MHFLPTLRFSLSVVVATCCMSPSLYAQAPVQYVNTTEMNNAQDVHAPLPLWPNGAPGALGKAEADVPTVSVYLPAANPTHTAVIIAPGGAYTSLAMDHEGLQVAQWLNAHGRGGAGPEVPSRTEVPPSGGAAGRTASDSVCALDIALAMGFATDRIGMWGFSAGGHLAATTGTVFDMGNASAADPIDRVSSRPDFLILAYPVISMQDGVTHAFSQKMLLGDAPSAALKTSTSAGRAGHRTNAANFSLLHHRRRRCPGNEQRPYVHGAG